MIFDTHTHYDDEAFQPDRADLMKKLRESGIGKLVNASSDWESLEQNQYVAVYLPDREIYYQVFAAVPYNNLHILYYYDFDDQLSYRKFINSIYASSELDAVTVSERKPAYGDRLLILSTCLWGDKNSRYLVLARELSE